jgi:hypothetical protein
MNQPPAPSDATASTDPATFGKRVGSGAPDPPSVNARAPPVAACSRVKVPATKTPSGDGAIFETMPLNTKSP